MSADRPRIYRCKGVVLRRRNLGEGDSIFTIYGEPLGKFDAIAKGVRKVRSKMRGHLEPLVYVDLLIARGRSLDVITQAQAIEPFMGLRDNLSSGAAGVYCAELIDRFIADHAQQDGLLDLFLDVLTSISLGAPRQVIRQFELALLEATGYQVQLDACAHCGERLAEEETLFSAQAGGLVCRQCRPSAGQGRIISVRAIKVLRYCRGASNEDAARLRLDDEVAHELEAAMLAMITYVLDREPTSRSFVEDVAALEKRTSVLPPRTMYNESTPPGLGT